MSTPTPKSPAPRSPDASPASVSPPAAAAAPPRRARRWIVRLVLVVIVVGLGFGLRYASHGAELIAGYSAKHLASGVFVSGLPPERILADELSRLRFLVGYEIDRERQSVTTHVGLSSRRAIYRPGLGATLVIADGEGSADDERRVEETLRAEAERFGPGAPAPAELAIRGRQTWPAGEREPDAPPPAGFDAEKLAKALDGAFAEPDPSRPIRTRAAVVVWKGRVIAERYADGISRDMPLNGWSMTKSVTHALVGILAREGKLDVNAPLAHPAWQAPGDPRAAITLDHLLRMQSGLEFDESYYEPNADAVLMLFRRPDTASYAAAQPLLVEPDTKWWYQSGSTNLVTWAIQRAFGEDRAAHWRFPRRALFDVLGMRTAVIEPDTTGNFVGSSFMLASARDWARFGMLYLQDGVWDGQRILPEGWVAYAARPSPGMKKGRYGAHWWLNVGSDEAGSDRPFPELPRDALLARGFHEQAVCVFPSQDLVVVRLGVTEWPVEWDIQRFLVQILDALPAPAAAGAP